jgi:ribosome-associated translation inhibitor RaiA
MNVSLKGTGLALTADLYLLVAEKCGDAFRAFGDTDLDAVTVNVELEHTSRRYREREAELPYRAEATVFVPGATLRAEGSADTIEPALVEMKHALARQIGDWRRTQRDARREGEREIANS